MSEFVFLNGEFVTASEARVSVFDRGFMYGDGLFESLRVSRGRPFQWEAHWSRLEAGAQFLHLQIPARSDRLLHQAQHLVQRNAMLEALLRIQLTRGNGPRGYALEQAGPPTLLMSLHPMVEPRGDAPPRWRLITSATNVLSDDPLARFKTANKLPQIMARIDAGANGADDALLVNDAAHVVETSCANVFWMENGVLHTPPLSAGCLPGVTRAVVMEMARASGLAVREAEVEPAHLQTMEGLFLTLSSHGIVEVTCLDGRPLPSHPVTSRLYRAYWEGVAASRG